MSKFGCPTSDTDANSVTVLRKSGPTSKTLKSTSAVNAALRSGLAVETNKKMMAGGNRQHSSNVNTLRLDEETDQLHHEKVSLTMGKAMQQARAAKGMTQKELATAVNEKPQVVTEYENGKAVPNQQILNKLERALGVKLRGKDIGSPLAPSKPKK